MKLGPQKTKLLLKIVSQRQQSIDDQLKNALTWTTEALGLEIGIISHIENDTYTVKQFYPEESGLEAEQQFELQNTYCSLAIEQEDVFRITKMSTSEYSEEPCFQAFGLESYIGKPFQIQGTLFGTVNFSSSKSRSDFNEEEITFMKLLSEWVGSTLHQVQINRQLNEEHALYKLITTNSSELICMHEMDGTYTYVSPSVKNLLGYSPRELIGNSPYNFFHPMDIEHISNNAHEHAKVGNLYPSIQYRILRKDGTYIWFDTATQPVKNEDGEVIQLQTTSREITERKRLEILFEQSQTMAKVGGWEYDLEHGELFWSKEVYHIHEVDPSTSINVEQAMDFYPSGDSRVALEQAMNNTIENGDTAELELPFITAKGKNLWVRVIINPDFLGPKVVKLYGSFQDITESKRLEELFRKSQEMANVGGWEYDLETGDLFWTDEVYRIHEVELGTPVKVEDGVSFYPEGFSRDTITAAIGNAVATGDGWDEELPFITAKGNNIWVRAKGYAEFLDGKAIRLKGTFQDITQRKEREELIKDQLDQLTELKVTREKLYSVIAHDLKNSIFGVKGLLDLVIEDLEEADVEKEELIEKLKLVFTSADFSHKLLDNMLTWIRLQSGILHLQPKTFDLAKSLEFTIDILQPSIKSKEIDIQTSFETDTEIEGDPNLVATVLRNLLNNAIKFSEKRSVIEINCRAQNENEITIAIKDYGLGMNEETLLNLFNDDKRPNKIGTSEEKGTGLGLILVKELLEKQQGSIQVQSTEGEGAVFTITLPRILAIEELES